MDNRRVVSGIRPTGKLHLGNYHGAVKNWVQLQYEYDSFFFIADYHALTTNYENTANLEEDTWNLVSDLLAVGLDPGAAKLFIQSWVPEHAELHLLLSMLTPLSWLERVPTYKDQIEKLKERELATYGFLGYPLLQAADILLYKPFYVPVGEDQVHHVELTREIARRFNYIYGRGNNFEEYCYAALKKLGKKSAKLFSSLQKKYREQGNMDAYSQGHSLILESQNITMGEQALLLGFFEGTGKTILPEPEVLLTKTAKFPGLDGQKMSKSYANTIAIASPPAEVEKKIAQMLTDPARVRRIDPGCPEKCPVWALHKFYANTEELEWVETGCRTAGIGCLECKALLADNINKEQQVFIERKRDFAADPAMLKNIVQESSQIARELASATLEDIKDAMGMTRL